MLGTTVLMRRFRLIIIVVVVLLAALFLGLSWKNALVVKSVAFQVKADVREHTDHTLLGLGAAHHLPDYRVKLRVSRRFLDLDLGTKLNTSATNWLEYPVNDIVPLRRVQEVIIIEDDKMENDILERIQGASPEMEGSQFRYRLTATRSFDEGMNWFFATPVGKALAAGIIIGVALLILGLFRR